MKMVDNIEKAAVLAYHGTDRADFLRFDIGAALGWRLHQLLRLRGMN